MDLSVIQAKDFVCLDASEQLNFEASKQVLRTLAQACRKRGIDRALFDIRTIPISEKPQFTPTELAELLETFHEAGFDETQRLAVLYRADPHGRVRMFAFIAKIRGFQVQAFEDFEAAFRWLSEEEVKHVGLQEGAVPISISHPTTETRATRTTQRPQRRLKE
jgi:hypothetical protein